MTAPPHPTRLSALKVYRHFMIHLQLIPDAEIRHFYYHKYRAMTCEAIAATILKSGPASGICSPGTKSPEKLLSELRKEARAIEAATGGAHKTYARMMEKTYARRGKRRWELLEALFPVSLQRPQPMVAENPSSLSRRSRSPPPYPGHIAPLIPKKKSLETPARAVLKPPTVRFLANRAWEERADQLRKLNIPLALRIRRDVDFASTSRTANGDGVLRPLDLEDVAILSRDMPDGERRRLIVWLNKGNTMLSQIEKMKALRGDLPRPPISSLSQAPGKFNTIDKHPVDISSRPRLQLSTRTIQRMYCRLSDTLPTLIGVRSGQTISWQQSVSKRRTTNTGYMSLEEAQWIL